MVLVNGAGASKNLLWYREKISRPLKNLGRRPLHRRHTGVRFGVEFGVGDLASRGQQRHNYSFPLHSLKI